jgi:hypothetical protein
MMILSIPSWNDRVMQRIVQSSPDRLVMEAREPGLRWIGLVFYGLLAVAVTIAIVNEQVQHMLEGIFMGGLITFFLLSGYFTIMKDERIEIDKEKQRISIDVHYYKQSKNRGIQTIPFNDIARILYTEPKRRIGVDVRIELKPDQKHPETIFIGTGYCKLLSKCVPDIKAYWTCLFAGIPIVVDIKNPKTSDGN